MKVDILSADSDIELPKYKQLTAHMRAEPLSNITGLLTDSNIESYIYIYIVTYMTVTRRFNMTFVVYENIKYDL